MPTLFEKIIAREIPADIIYEDDAVVAFRDIAPQAPVHVLIVPRLSIPRLEQAGPEHADLLGRMFLAASRIAAREGVADGGYRLVLNNGDDAGQVVQHLHLHLLGGRQMGWPPG